MQIEFMDVKSLVQEVKTLDYERSCQIVAIVSSLSLASRN